MVISRSRGYCVKIDIIGFDNSAVVASLVENSRWRLSTVYTPDTGKATLYPVTASGDSEMMTMEALFFTHEGRSLNRIARNSVW